MRHSRQQPIFDFSATTQSIYFSISLRASRVESVCILWNAREIKSSEFEVLCPVVIWPLRPFAPILSVGAGPNLVSCRIDRSAGWPEVTVLL